MNVNTRESHGATTATLPLLLDMRQVAEQLGIDRATVYAKLVTPGKLRTVFIGRSRRVARQDLEEFVDQLRKEAREASNEPPAA